MSLQFYSSTNKDGIVDLIYANTGLNTTSYPLAEVTRDVNIALDKALSIILQADGKWQFDDSNHTDYPIITTNLVDGQRDYSFTTDEQGNLILDIYRVMVKDQDGKFYDIQPVDQQTRGTDSLGFVDGQNEEGEPTKYDKTANGIFLDKIPSYNSTGGLKIFINRETTYFTASDTTKKPGFAGIFHEYLALRPSYQVAYRKGLQNVQLLREEMLLMEQKIKEYYGQRAKDEKVRIAPATRGCGL
jgi:hypothetical protein